jgi:hypothetical protein
MKKISIVMITGVLFILSPATVFAANINGLIGIVMESGDIKYGAKINILLVTKEFPVRKLSRADFFDDNERYMRAKGHALADANDKIRTELNENSLNIKATTITGLDGKFKFADIKPGKYFIVTLPSTIARNIVFWQIPIDITKKDITIELSNDNLTLSAKPIPKDN